MNTISPIQFRSIFLTASELLRLIDNHLLDIDPEYIDSAFSKVTSSASVLGDSLEKFIQVAGSYPLKDLPDGVGRPSVQPSVAVGQGGN